MNIKLLKRAGISLAAILPASLLATLLATVALYLGFRRRLDGIEYTSGKAAVQLLIELVALAFFLITVCAAAYIRGKRRTRREKLTVELFSNANALAMLAFILPALIFMNWSDPMEHQWLKFIYMPFLSLFNSLGVTQLSVITVAVAAAGLQSLCYAWGRKIWEHRSNEE